MLKMFGRLGRSPARKKFKSKPSNVLLIFRSRAVEDFAFGYGSEEEVKELLRMAELPASDQEVKDYLKEQPQNPLRDFRISVGILKGHAALIIQDFEPEGDAPPIELLPNPVKRDGYLESHPNLRLVHLRHKRDSEGNKIMDLMELARHVLHSERTEYSRCVDLLYSRTTARVLKRIELRSCPPEHRILFRDCATFAQNFVREFVDFLRASGEISEGECETMKQRCVQHIHVLDDSLGDSEAGSRGQVYESEEAGWS
ncbi:putative HNH nuclease domain-containing protein [Seiridium cardinale]